MQMLSGELSPLLAPRSANSKVKGKLYSTNFKRVIVYGSEACAYEGEGYAAFGENIENDDQMGVWVWCDSLVVRAGK